MPRPSSVTRRAGVAGLLVSLLALGLVGAAVSLLLGAGDESARAATSTGAAARADRAAADLPPLPGGSRAQVVQPVAGAQDDAAVIPAGADLDTADPAPDHAATRTSRRGAHSAGASDLPGASAVNQATALGNGVALPPLDAPEAVKQIIAAGNSIARTPYVWGGGHGRWLDKGYDCSGSVSYALAAAGLLDAPLTSGSLAGWGEPGTGRWVTIYANDGHVFLEVAGIRFDTSAQRVTGSRWAPDGRSTAGFVARHPAGL